MLDLSTDLVTISVKRYAAGKAYGSPRHGWRGPAWTTRPGSRTRIRA